MGDITKNEDNNTNEEDTITFSNNNADTTTTTTTATATDTDTTPTNTISTTTTRSISSNLCRVLIFACVLLVRWRPQEQSVVAAFRVNISARHHHVFTTHLFREHASIQLHGRISAREGAFLLQQTAAIGSGSGAVDKNRNKTNHMSLATPAADGGGMADDGGDGGGGDDDGGSVTLRRNDDSEVPNGLNVVDEIHSLLKLPDKVLLAAAARAVPNEEGEEEEQNEQGLPGMGRDAQYNDDDELEDSELEYEDVDFENSNKIYIFDNNNNNKNKDNNNKDYKIPSFLIVFVVSMNVAMTILYLAMFAIALFLSSQKRTQRPKLRDIIYTEV